MKSLKLLLPLCGMSLLLFFIEAKAQLPDHLIVARDSVADMKDDVLHIPGISEEINQDVDTYAIKCSAFGVIPVKEIQVDVEERQKVYPGGFPIGIYMKTKGVLIVGTGEVCDVDGNKQEPVGDLVQSGDYILAVNHIPVMEKEQVVDQMNQAVGGSVELSVLRNNEIIELNVPVVQTGDSEYKAGIWIRDDTQGIGTLTYWKEDGSFGALGHGISDIDTSTLLSLEEGNLYQTEIKGISKGESGMPGEVTGVIRYQDEYIIGSINSNTELGIFGDGFCGCDDSDAVQEIEVGYKQEIKPGDAVILSKVDGELKAYDIQIEKLNLNSGDANKGMVIRVTDPQLLELTGGIIQGMSGSPILQNGRIVGAVTHVFVNDPTKGYGIFIENMLDH